ncbi:hypothetical protein MSI_26260 [Treponema sp. JC4]|uniref:hypothetical protein n=1 Tax=Treponema sp. JC4 TaxID=1124982 RepID=UPI00025B0B21|nr:hypothetical protein [Treponema sp. JC4]EID83959.1 hypothetical protein MSI_26260 [Treponema sp. JC4]
MENGGFTNIVTLHMEKGDKARHLTKCSFWVEDLDVFGTPYNKCLAKNEKCSGSSHCTYYTESACKAIAFYDELYHGHNSKECEYIDLKGRWPSCLKEFPHKFCFGNGHTHCSLKNQDTCNFINDDVTVESFDIVKLQRQENNKYYTFTIDGVSINCLPQFKSIILNLLGKRLHDKIEVENHIWEIVSIQKSEKPATFIVHKKNESKVESDKTLICRICKEKILSKDLKYHLKTKHPRRKKNYHNEQKIINRMLLKFND